MSTHDALVELANLYPNMQDKHLPPTFSKV